MLGCIPESDGTAQPVQPQGIKLNASTRHSDKKFCFGKMIWV